MATKEKSESITIKEPNFQRAIFKIIGTAPLVIRRMSSKTVRELEDKQIGGTPAGNRKKREPKSSEETYQEAKSGGLSGN